MLPVSYQEIDAWNRLTRADVNPYEVKILRSMDIVRTRIWNQRADTQEPERLIDVRDGNSIANLFRGMKQPKETPE